MLRDRPGLGATAGAEHRHLRTPAPGLAAADRAGQRRSLPRQGELYRPGGGQRRRLSKRRRSPAGGRRGDEVPGGQHRVHAARPAGAGEGHHRRFRRRGVGPLVRRQRRRRSTSITSIRCRSASIWCCAPAPTATTSANRFRCASATKSASCRSANRTAPSPCASTTRAARRRSALPAGADRAERERQRRLYAEEAGHRPGVAEGRSGRPRLLIPFTGAVFSLPRPSFRPSFYALLRLTCDGKTPQPRHRAGTSKEKV